MVIYISEKSMDEKSYLNQNQKLYCVRGKSMENYSIYDGDFVIVDQQSQIVGGDIVVINTPSNNLLVKKFYHRGKHLIFTPFSLPPISRTIDQAVFIGKVVGIIHQY